MATSSSSRLITQIFADNNNDDSADSADSDEGANLAAEFFQMAQQKGVQLNSDDLDDDDDEEDDEEDSVDSPVLDLSDAQDADDVNLTDDQLYSEVKERVLDTAGGFVDYVKSARGDDDDDDYDDQDELLLSNRPKPYTPPTTVPDPELTAGEVVLLVLQALTHNDEPTPNRGVEILFGYSSSYSQIKNEQGLTPAEYAEFLKETEYKVLFAASNNENSAQIEKADYSFDGRKAFFTARLASDTVNVNFILSSDSESSSWLIDSMLIRPQSMRRRRRK